MGFRFLTVMLTIIAVTDVLEAGWFRRTLRKIGRGIKKGVRRVGNAIKKAGKKLICKAGFLFVCPAAVAAVGSAAGIGTGGLGALAIGAGMTACRVGSKRCKRSAPFDPEEFVYVPFSPRFSDYDLNQDKEITYEEFVYAIMSSIPLDDPEDLEKPFIFADANNDGILDTQEFIVAPFIWADDLIEDASNSTAIAA